MGFNKRIISEETIRLIANDDDFKKFYNYFKSDSIFLSDTFSSDILNKIRKYSIENKDEIIKIMNECK
jgi:hypothetical protein